MQVLRAETLGMCFGVRDALKIIGSVEQPSRVTIHGELVHNESVLIQLRTRGFGMSGETDRPVPDTDQVLITAHGISDAERSQLEKAGKQLIDTTCPLVRRVHEAAQKLHADGYHVLVLGKRDHVEVRGIVGDLQNFDVIGTVEDVKTYPAKRLGVVCQTTMPTRAVGRILQAIHMKNPGSEVRFIDTVCQPTKEHQRALERLLPLVDVMVVVGGKNSNNTRELVERCREHGLQAHHVQDAGELEEGWFANCRIIGLTAGTSTLDETIEKVQDRLESF